MINDVYIRRFEEKDVDELFDVIQRSLSTYLISKVYDENLLNLMHDFYTKKYILGSSKLKHLYVAILENHIVGSVAVNLDGNKTYVSMVYIDPLYQGKGIGRKLIETSEKDELSQKTKYLYLHAVLSAAKFYKKMGYDFPNTVPEIVIDAGIDFVTMEKHI